MELAAAAMEPLLRKLGELVIGELTLERRVREDVLSLQREMTFMHAALRKVAEVPADQLDEQVALWAREVRELSYDMDDAVDAFTVRVGEPARGGGGGGGGPIKKRIQELLKKTARLFGKGKELHQIAGAVGDAQSLAEQLAELRQRYGRLELLQDGGASSSGSGTTGGGGAASIDPRLTAMFTEATELVGVDRSRDELIHMMMMSDGSKEHVQTVSIVGFGGLGKTTLAKAVYDRVKVQFDCGAFVSVSRSPDITRIFKKMLYELDEEKYANINEAVRDLYQLITELRRFLQSKRYIIVIDDIWDEKTWETIKCALPENNSSSRVITTSRKLSVSEASCSSSDDHIYRMKPLSENDSQKLFYKRIFHRGEGCPPELEQVSKDILKKCGGVPLAIISIASLLASHHKHTRAKDEWHIVLNSIGRGLTDGGNVEDMHRILSFSYDDLPCHLKACLLYLSIFPEDYEIQRGRLIWRWIAEGLIEHKKGESNLFETGDRYFQDLINRSMIQPICISGEGKAVSCRVHDMVLDLIRSISRQENFVTIWDGYGSGTTNQGNSLLAGSKIRRLSLQSTATTTTCPATASLLQVRSFTLFNAAIDSMPSLSQFQVLRVLDLEGCDLKKCGSGGHSKLRHIGNLCHLRYLGLRRTYIRELPEETGKLQFLQTLDVRGAHGLQELPPTITGLRNLMCLHLDWDTRLPYGLISNLSSSLLELTGLRVGHDSAADVVRELRHLTALRVLTMRWEQTDFDEALVQYLGDLPKIQSLDMYVIGGRGDLMRRWVPPPGLRRFLSKGPSCALSVLPAWVSSSSIPFVSCLEVWVRQVRRGDLQVLGTLPALRSLRLRATSRIEDRGSMERGLAVHAGAFPCVRACAFLHFVTMPSMFPRGAMPMVQQLQFSVRAWDWDVSVAGGGGGLGWDDDLRMDHLPSLEEVYVELWYRKKDGDEVQQVAAALRRAADRHPNRPTLRVNRRISNGRRAQQGRISTV